MIQLATLFLMMAAGDGVTYIPAKDVTAAQLVKPPAPIVTSDHYSVTTVKRTAPGQSEVHAKETDIFYVIDGAATFITGGTIVEGKTTAPDQIRGSSIKGGESRHVAKGDVFTVPKGTPHWVSAVEGSFTYVVVKVM
jgi:quercetin dioxygenase-like cupin family protein